MKIIKRSTKNTEQARTVSNTFNTVLVEVPLEKFFDKIELNIGAKEGVFIEKRSAKILLDHKNRYIQNSDRKAIKILILHQLFHAITRQYMKKLPHVIEDVIINKDLIKRGYGDDLLYFYYIHMVNHPKHIENIEDFLELNIPWLSFFSLDSYNSEFLKKMTTRFEGIKKFESQSKKLFSVMKKDMLNQRNQKIAINAYKNIVNECKKCK